MLHGAGGAAVGPFPSPDPPMTQTYQTHRQLPGLFFRVTVPVATLALGLSLWAVRPVSRGSLATVALAFAIVLTLLATRRMATTAQDRVIRLEMQLRLARVLPADLQGRVGELTVGQLIGLRFASDDELPGLVRRVLAGELRGREEIKRSITTWVPDTLRV